jgi:hypothetical protein
MKQVLGRNHKGQKTLVKIVKKYTALAYNYKELIINTVKKIERYLSNYREFMNDIQRKAKLLLNLRGCDIIYFFIN